MFAKRDKTGLLSFLVFVLACRALPVQILVSSFAGLALTVDV
jgi:hypothetical protein